MVWERQSCRWHAALQAIVGCVFVWAATAIMVTVAAAVSAQDADPPASGIRPAVEQVFAVRGGVLMVPLAAQTPGDNWPAWMTIDLADGTSIDGQVAWIAPRSVIGMPHMRRWTDEALPLTVRPVRPDDSTASTTGTPTLLAPLPLDGAGDLVINNRSVRTVWLDPPAPFAPGVDLPDMPALAASNRPSPTSPLAYWRWVLLAERIGARPPAISNFSGIEQMVARSTTDLWLVGMRALEQADANTAGALRDLLTATCDGRRGPIAAWVTRPDSLRPLLGVLLDHRRAPTRRVLDVQSWIDDQPDVLVWPVRLYGRQPQIAALNRTSRPIDLELAWVRSEGPTDTVRLRGGEVRMFTVNRPTTLENQRLGERAADLPLVLDVRFGARRSSIQFPAQAIAANPPGVEMRGLHLPLTLADVEMAQQPVVGEEHATFVHVRKRSGRWEVFVDCRRPGGPGDPSGDGQLPLTLRNPEDLLGCEALILLLGNDERDPDRPSVMLVIPENGWWKVVRGENDGTLQIHRRSYEDRWLCRIVLPDAWATRITSDADEIESNAGIAWQLWLAVCRTHGDHQSIETGPGRITSWQTQPAPMHIDLDRWDG